MTRTGQQRIRRSRLADAAAGIAPVATGTGVSRIRVVIYTCVQPGSLSSTSLVALRSYAEARDWTVVGEYADQVPALTPAADRPLWPSVAELIESGQANGIVTDIPPTDADNLDAWLAGFHAFSARVRPRPHEPYAAADAAAGHVTR